MKEIVEPKMDNRPIIILIPVYNDWLAVTHLLKHLDEQLHLHGVEARVVLADDGSTSAIPEAMRLIQTIAIKRVDLLRLRRNLGHQRALAVGLSYIEAHLPCDGVVVMDGDGEDDPHDVPRLLRQFDESHQQHVVFAERTRRSESITFRIFYKLYRSAHLLLTGEHVRVGNFSIIPYPFLKNLVVVSDLWNHYAASIYKARLPYLTIPSKRGTRFAGESRMNFVSLVIHGLSAMAVFGDRIGVRLLAATAVLSLLDFGALLFTLAIRFGTNLAIPGWATYTIGILLVMLLQMLLVLMVFVFMILAGRDGATFLPLRDYSYFVQSFEEMSMIHD